MGPKELKIHAAAPLFKKKKACRPSFGVSILSLPIFSFFLFSSHGGALGRAQTARVLALVKKEIVNWCDYLVLILQSMGGFPGMLNV